MDIYTELTQLSEKYAMPVDTMRNYWADMEDYHSEGCPYGNCEEGFSRWKSEKQQKLGADYLED